MQSRTSNSQTRLVLIGCLGVLLVTGVLYFMKRLEASRLSAELSATKVDKRSSLDELNGKVTDLFQKMEEMNKELANLQSKLKSCEDDKANLDLEIQTSKKAVSECMEQQSSHMSQQENLEEEIATLKDQCDQANDKAKEHLSTMNQLQQSAKEAEIELDNCQTEATRCQTTLNRVEAELVQAKARCDQLSPPQNPPQSLVQPSNNQNIQGQFPAQFPRNIQQQSPAFPGVPQVPRFPAPNRQAVIPGGIPNQQRVPSQQVPVDSVENDEGQNEPAYPGEDEDKPGNPLAEDGDNNDEDDYQKKADETIFGDDSQLGEANKGEEGIL